MQFTFTPEFLSRDQALFTKYTNDYVKVYNSKISFGTAGFRAEAKHLEYVTFRTGVFVSYYAKLFKGQTVGVQITASHNPAEDNGIKIIGPDGLSMKTQFEPLIEEFTNTESLEKAVEKLKEGLASDGKDIDWTEPAYVLVGCDTRASSPNLQGILIEALNFGDGVKHLNFGIVTTPQLHFMVLTFNKSYKQNLPRFDYDTKQLLNIYYETFGGAILEAFDLLTEMGLYNKDKKKKLFVDCSNGVGGMHQERLTQEYLHKIFDVVNINTKDTLYLNEDCGSEFVQKEKKLPRGLLDYINKNINESEDLDKMSFLSYDGDADRTVYFRAVRNNSNAELFEGDKMGALYALFCQRTLNEITELQKKVPQVDLKEDFSKWIIGAALTAYANGTAQTYYRDTLKVKLMIEPSGVKNLHRAAEKFDIGVYFESNGHGTVIYEHNKIHKLEEAVQISKQAAQLNDDGKQLHNQLKLLYLFLSEGNQGVGDAISNLLQIETALAAMKMGALEFKALYDDLCSATSKVKVKNKSVIQVSRDQSRITSPIDIQNKIDEICSQYKNGRAFLRPSGTEDVCRLYVEASDSKDVNEIQRQISEFVLANKDVN